MCLFSNILIASVSIFISNDKQMKFKLLFSDVISYLKGKQMNKPINKEVEMAMRDKDFLRTTDMCYFMRQESSDVSQHTGFNNSVSACIPISIALMTYYYGME